MISLPPATFGDIVAGLYSDVSRGRNADEAPRRSAGCCWRGGQETALRALASATADRFSRLQAAESRPADLPIAPEALEQIVAIVEGDRAAHKEDAVHDWGDHLIQSGVDIERPLAAGSGTVGDRLELLAGKAAALQGLPGLGCIAEDVAQERAADV